MPVFQRGTNGSIGCFTNPERTATPGKGLKGENCNVAACQKPNSADYYNRYMAAWYCRECAVKIETVARRDGMTMFNIGDTP